MPNGTIVKGKRGKKPMRIYCLLFLFMFQLPTFAVDFSYSLSAKQYANDPDRLEKRIQKLERKTKKLQSQFNRLQLQEPCQCGTEVTIKTHDEDLPEFSCFLQTAFKTYTATGKTKVNAKGKVLKLCNNDRALGCKPSEIECD